VKYCDADADGVFDDNLGDEVFDLYLEKISFNY